MRGRVRSFSRKRRRPRHCRDRGERQALGGEAVCPVLQDVDGDGIGEAGADGGAVFQRERFKLQQLGLNVAAVRLGIDGRVCLSVAKAGGACSA